MKKEILIVEDEEIMLNILIDRFELEGWRVFSAKNGKEGLKLALRERPDVILLDILMPKMNGWQMREQLFQADESFKQIPIIFLTNVSDDNFDLSIEKRNSYFDYLVKIEHNLETIIKKVDSIVNKKLAK